MGPGCWGGVAAGGGTGCSTVTVGADGALRSNTLDIFTVLYCTVLYCTVLPGLCGGGDTWPLYTVQLGTGSRVATLGSLCPGSVIWTNQISVLWLHGPIRGQYCGYMDQSEVSIVASYTMSHGLGDMPLEKSL